MTRRLNLFGHRDFTLALTNIGLEAESLPLLHLDNFQLTRPYFIVERKNKKVSYYIDFNQVDLQKDEIYKRICKDKNYILNLIDDARKEYLKIEQNIDDQKPLELKELFKFINTTRLVWRYWAGLWWTIELLEEKKIFPDLLEELMVFRKQTEKFAPGCDQIIRLSIQKIYPNLNHLAEVVLESEVLKNEIPDKSILEERFRYCLLMNSVIYIGSDIENKIKESEIELYTPRPQDFVKGNVIEGKTAFKGNYKGIARIVITKEQANLFKKGDVLVSSSTTPDLMPAIVKAGAIITDEGGIVSHAAITSRELKIPCIIATKVATQVLKDGDLVEVDAEKGIVRIVDRK